MKIIYKITAFVFMLVLALACTKNEDNLYSFDYIGAPTKVSAVFNIMQDNTGLVSIFPDAQGAQSFNIDFGDNSGADSISYQQGETAEHYYTEGTYNVKITAKGITGLTAEYKQQINVSFKAPENLEITVENDVSVSKQVNLSAKADYATVFEFYFGEVANEEPVMAMPDELKSHVYANPGTYTIRVVAKGGAIAVIDSTFAFEALEITGPVTAAPTPPSRPAASVISIFSNAYSNIPNSDYNPDWGQSTVVSIEDISGKETLKYANLNYQGTQFGNTVDATFMEFLHIDMWTVDATSVDVFPISASTDEYSYNLPIESGKWVSYDIPMSYFTNLGLSISDLIQFKFVGSDASSIYLDNLYFYKGGTASSPVLPLDFESPEIDYAFVDFDGGASTVIDNPQSNGINTSSKVTRMVKNAGQVWGGSLLTLAGPIDFSSSKTFTMKVFSPKVGGKVLLKVENKDDSDINYEMEASTTTANAWEELNFDYSGIDDSKEYHNLVFIFDLGTMGDGTTDFTYLYDDVALGGSVIVPGAEVFLPVDFESTTLNYRITDFDGAGSEILDNPQPGGINTSSKVVKVIRNGGEVWAGSYLVLDKAIDFSIGKTFKLKVLSPAVGTKVLLKIENKDDAGINHQVEVATTTANAWEELSFDYSGVDDSKAYQNVVVIFDLGTTGDGSSNSTYLFDDIIQTN